MGILKPDTDDCSTLPAVLEPSQRTGKRRAGEWTESEDRVRVKAIKEHQNNHETLA